MTTEPLGEKGQFVQNYLRRISGIEDSVVLKYTRRTKEGFYISQVLFVVLEGVELIADDTRRLCEVCRPEGQAEPIVFP